jgi:pimeloyl-ACP methyl ester carboxylesterase
MRRARQVRRARRRAGALALSLGALAVGALCVLAPPTGARGAADVVELGVSFPIKNTDTSGAPCPTDGADYTVRGHITAPASALTGSGPVAIALYLGGLETPEWLWRFDAVPGYDYATELAKAGLVSLTVDELGYGASGRPYGYNVCWGSQADVAHQIVGELRSGSYDVEGRAALKFQRIALVGHDVGGAFAEIEAYSYKDIDALVLATWSDQGQTPLLEERFARWEAFCATGGMDARPGGPGGYFYAEQPEEYKPDLFLNGDDPAVIAAYIRMRQPNPCGYEPTAIPTLFISHPRLGEVRVPVLLTIGAEDKIWTQDGWSQQQGLFTGSSDVTSVSLANTAHYPMLEGSAPAFRGLLANWLIRHGYGTATRTSPPPPSSAPPLVRVARPTAWVARDRIAPVSLTCLARSGSECAGTLHLETARLAVAPQSGPAPNLGLGAAAFRIAGAQTQTLEVQLSRTGYKRLRRVGRIRAVATLLERAPDGTVTTARNRLTLKAKG